MLKIADKSVLTEVQEILQPGHTAVLVVDMQNDFCSQGGVFASLGHDLHPVRKVIPSISALLTSARSVKASIFYIMMTCLPEYASWAPAYIGFNLRHLGLPPGTLYCLPETWGWEIVDELAPSTHDSRVLKWRSSGFAGTNLNMLLQSRGIATVVVCGTATHACVESTVRDSMNLDYYTVVPADCVAALDSDLHTAALKIMAKRVLLVDSSDISNVWQATKAKSHEPMVRLGS
jgi:nicotinamidase-related amidase